MFATIALTLSLTFSGGADASSTAPLIVPCPWEDTNNGEADNAIDTACLWDARNFGNGRGNSFIAFPDGTFVYVNDARWLIRDTTKEMRQWRKNAQTADTPEEAAEWRNEAKSARHFIRTLRAAKQYFQILGNIQ